MAFEDFNPIPKPQNLGNPEEAARARPILGRQFDNYLNSADAIHRKQPPEGSMDYELRYN